MSSQLSLVFTRGGPGCPSVRFLRWEKGSEQGWGSFLLADSGTSAGRCNTLHSLSKLPASQPGLFSFTSRPASPGCLPGPLPQHRSFFPFSGPARALLVPNSVWLQVNRAVTTQGGEHAGSSELLTARNQLSYFSLEPWLEVRLP